MPPAKRRKLSPTSDDEPHEPDQGNQGAQNEQDERGDAGSTALPAAAGQDQAKESTIESSTTQSNAEPEPEPSSSNVNAAPLPPASSSTTTSAADRLARFAALKSRATASAKSNLAEAKAEANRAAMDPGLLASLNRKAAIASHNLLKAETEEEEGTGAFERKRAWDYTIEETEKWDARVQQKKYNRDNNAFQDYSTEASKMYDRQIRELEKAARKDGGKNREEYERQKAELLEQAARTGGLEIVEMDNGELVAIDKDGRFYANHDSTGFVEQKPKRENVDRLVADLKKAEEARFKKRRDRGRESDDGDVTYINDKNKQFNLKLARFYDRYTADIRESFERGTAI
ncbi:Pre-mRNA-splicing factor SYF2 [Exophiala dermatitidis]|uniref:Pre-mRNA-splicing factor SYF2 n=1 Tax=Exophiala dermatitidis TaxID=5970 RepID=A0AAN6IUV2_EXODE|nr:Pre-mRNA-splicing factor SYF2 [Exophiala dermatitidis]KAJ4515927.1 Pre-mRNA-splicing factor SYF2 [Exophiala dermatitidis]KAJ4518667.1 Pre-mRNA-splicing factor SYF2 [Exophiala dermatitidis]KAJ4534180.1 Pre-mRNA-splicing factor SYF2 [Exophiala dermatitidis]KAJ4545921.1 Pre-mRNA-splicing factor SYF2 [Exophiala dermatitidis]